MRVKIEFILLLFVSLLFAGEVELELDFSSPDPLTAAIMRGAEQAYEVNLEGLNALERGDLKLAEVSFRKAMNLIPLYSDAQNNLGVVFYRTNRSDSALALWQGITVTDESYHLSWYNLGLHAFDNEKYGKAADLLKKAEQRNKRFAQAKFLRAQCYYELNQLKKAGSLIKEAYAITPKDLNIKEFYAFWMLESQDTLGAINVIKGDKSTRMISLHGEILALQGKWAEAIPLLESVHKKDTTGMVSQLLVDVYLDNGDVDKALGEIKRAKKSLDSLPASMWINAAFALSEKDKPEEAIKWLKKGYDKNHDPDMLYNLGQLYYRVGKYDQSIRHIELLPEEIRDGQSFYVLSNAYLKIKDIAKAKEAIYSALYYNTNPQYYVMLGRLLVKEDKKESAKIQFQKALSIDKDLEDAKIELALLAEGGDLTALISVLEKRVEGCKECYSEKNRLALLYQKNDQWQKGVELIGKGWAKNGELALTLFYILERAGEYKQAKSIMQKAIRKKVVPYKDQLVFAQFLSEYRYYTESIELCKKLLSVQKDMAEECCYLMGYNFMKENEYKKSARYLEKAYKANRDNMAARSALAYVLNELGDSKRAEELWIQSSKSQRDVTTFTNLGLLSYEKGEYKKALSYYSKALDTQENKALYINMGDVYFALEEYGHALHAYKKAVSSKDSIDAYCGIYWSAKKVGNSADRKVALQKVGQGVLLDNSRRVLADNSFETKAYTQCKLYLEALNEKDSSDYFLMSQTSLELNELVYAQNAADSAISKGYKKELMRSHLQALAYASGDLEKAKSLSGGSSTRDMYNKAVLLYDTKSYSEYLFYVKEKISYFDGEDALSLLQMAADCATFLKKWDELLYWSKRIYAINNSAGAAFNCAVAGYNLNDMETSYHYYKAARAIDPTIKNKDIEERYIAQSTPEDTTKKVETGLSSMDSLFNRAIVIHRKGDLKKAENIYKLILQQDDRYYRAWNNLGIIYGRQGDIEGAIKCYKSSISKRSDIADGYINLVYLYMALEEYKNAQKWLKKGLKQHADNEQLRQFEKELHKLN